jgi:hypothetical protein
MTPGGDAGVGDGVVVQVGMVGPVMMLMIQGDIMVMVQGPGANKLLT